MTWKPIICASPWLLIYLLSAPQQVAVGLWWGRNNWLLEIDLRNCNCLLAEKWPHDEDKVPIWRCALKPQRLCWTIEPRILNLNYVVHTKWALLAPMLVWPFDEFAPQSKIWSQFPVNRSYLVDQQRFVTLRFNLMIVVVSPDDDLSMSMMMIVVIMMWCWGWWWRWSSDNDGSPGDDLPMSTGHKPTLKREE